MGTNTDEARVSGRDIVVLGPMDDMHADARQQHKRTGFSFGEGMAAGKARNEGLKLRHP